MSEELRDYIEQNRIKTSPVYLQRFHATPPTGWINDPNGFIWFKGRYHLFGQFYPYGSQWGTMHWGHWVSDDLVTWNWSGVALMPDTDADRDGCFSGTAIVVDNKLVVLYSQFLNWGPIGTRYEWTDDTHTEVNKITDVPPEYSVWPEWRVNITPLAGPCALLTEVYALTHPDPTFHEYIDDQNVNGKQECLAELKAMPQGFLTKEEQTRASQLQPQLENIVNQYTMNWILDGGADEQWDEYVSALKNAGLDEFVAIYQAMYDRSQGGNK